MCYIMVVRKGACFSDFFDGTADQECWNGVIDSLLYFSSFICIPFAKMGKAGKVFHWDCPWILSAPLISFLLSYLFVLSYVSISITVVWDISLSGWCWIYIKGEWICIVELRNSIFRSSFSFLVVSLGPLPLNKSRPLLTRYMGMEENLCLSHESFGMWYVRGYFYYQLRKRFSAGAHRVDFC